MMKLRLLACAVLVVVCSMFVCNAEAFKLHNGVEFGMDKNEVIKLESKAGFELIDKHYNEPLDYYFYVYYYNNGALDIMKNKDCLYAEDITIGGYNRANLIYTTNEKGLVDGCYYHYVDASEFRRSIDANGVCAYDDADRILNAMIGKYGKPVTNRKDQLAVIPAKSFSAYDIYVAYANGIAEKCKHPDPSSSILIDKVNITMDILGQWLIEENDGLVEVMMIKVESHFVSGNVLKMDNKDTKEILISYRYIEAEEVEALKKANAERQASLSDF